jgi:hypothetical protein
MTLLIVRAGAVRFQLTIEGQPRTVAVGGKIVSLVDVFFGRIREASKLSAKGQSNASKDVTVAVIVGTGEQLHRARLPGPCGIRAAASR